MNDRLFMPEVIHCVVGEEISFYFANVYTTLNPDNYAFRFFCDKGSCCEERWHFTPAKEDVGTYHATLDVYDDDGVVASGKCSIVVHDPAASAGKKVRLLMVGDSLMDQSHYPTHIHTLCLRYGIDLEMLGTNVPEILRERPGQLIRYPEPELLKGVRHEGYGGWTAGTFLKRNEPVGGKTLKDACSFMESQGKAFHHWMCASPFINEKGEFDFGEYLEKNCGGKAPDIIMIGLGGNDLSGSNDDNFREKVDNFLNNMGILYGKLRQYAPDSLFGIVLNPYGARSQTAYGKNYGSKGFRWNWRRLKPRAMRELEQKFCGMEKTSIIPLYHSIDPVYGFPMEEVKAFSESDIIVSRQCNAGHPSPAGYRQMGIAAFGSLLDMIEKR